MTRCTVSGDENARIALPTPVACGEASAAARVHPGRLLRRQDLQVDDLGAVQDREVHGRPRRGPQVLHVGQRDRHQVALLRHQLPELEQPHAERVAALRLLHPAEFGELLGEPVRGRAGQSGATGEVGERQRRVLAVETLQDRRCTFDNGDRDVPLSGRHSLILGRGSGNV